MCQALVALAQSCDDCLGLSHSRHVNTLNTLQLEVEELRRQGKLRMIPNCCR